MGTCKHGHELTADNIFETVRGARRVYSCRSCRRKATTSWRNRNIAGTCERDLQSNAAKTAKRLGVTKDTIFRLRQSPCEICGGMGEPRHGKKQNHVDHDHSTNILRGSLCTSCNLGLGKFGDSEHLLLSAISYLRRYRRAAA